MKHRKSRLAYCLYLSLFLFSCSTNEPTFTLQEETINEGVYASGEILPNPYAFVQSATNEVISQILVKEGDEVSVGDVLAFLGAAEDDAQLTVLHQQLVLASAAADQQSPILKELREKIDAAKSRYQHDQKNAERYAKLALTAAVSQKEADDFALQAETSSAEVTKAQKQYEAKVNELAGAKLQIENALAQANNSLKPKVLHSKINGKVLSISKKVGESVQPGENIMLIGNDKSFQLKLFIDERDINKVKIGQQISFETDAYPKQVFHAQLHKIDALINTALRSVKAEATIDGTTFFYPQSAVEANILIKEQQKALLIPADYLRAGDTIIRKQGKDKQQIKVTTGLRIGSKVQITNGLRAGDILYKNK